MAKKTVKPSKAKLANPGERAKLADRYLSKSQLKQRQFNKWADTEVAPGLTNRLVARQANTDTKLRYGQQETDLLKQQAQIPQMAARDRSFFDDYVARINAAKVQAGVDTQNAVNAVGNLGQGLDESSARNWGAQQAQMQTDAQARGATVDPNLAQIAKNASTVRSGLTGSYGAMLASQGANTQANYANRALVGVQQGGEQARVRDQEVADMAKRILELHGEQGAYNTSRRSEIASSAADTALKNASTQSLIGDRAADNARADKTASRSASQWSSTVNKYGVTQGAWKDWGKTPTGKAKRAQAIKDAKPKPKPSTTDKDEYGNTGLQRTSRTSDLRKVQSLATAMRKSNKKLTWQDARTALGLKYGSVNADILTAAAQQATLGRVGPSTAAALKRLGLDPNRYRTK